MIKRTFISNAFEKYAILSRLQQETLISNMYIISRIICKKKKKPYKDIQTNQTGFLKIIQRKAEKENREISKQTENLKTK